MQAAPAHISDLEHRLPHDLPLRREIPLPGLRLLEVARDARYRDRRLLGSAKRCGRIVDRNVIYRYEWLEGRSGAWKYVVEQSEARDVSARARANDGLVVQLVGDPQPRLVLRRDVFVIARVV